MIDLIKAFGRGILYVILLPFFLLALAIFAVIGLGDFVFQIIRSIIYFFTGQKFFPELPEDRELRLRREGAQSRVMNEQQPMNESDAFRDSPIFHDYQETDLARNDEPVATSVSEEKPVFEENAPIQEEKREDLSDLLNDNIQRDQNDEDLIKPSFEQEQVEEEVLEQYRPKESTFSGQLDDDDDTDNGVNIGFDD